MVAVDAEAAIDQLTESTVPLTDRGEVKVLAWHGDRPSGNGQGRHADWLRRAREERQCEIEKRTAVFRAELERTL